MSLKDSMIRGLAVYGLSSMSQCGRANSSTLVDPSAPVRQSNQISHGPHNNKA